MKSEANIAENEVSRRDFLLLAMMSSAMLMSGGTMLEGEQVLPHARLRELAPGAVRPTGWLRIMLEKQAAQLGSKLPQVAWPFTGAFWAGEEKYEPKKPGQEWWPWEQKGYWIDGAARLALVLGDERLMKQVGESIRYTLSHADANGYLGPQRFKDPKGDYHRWPQSIFFRSLTACADAPSNMLNIKGEAIVEALRKHYLNDAALYGAPERNVINIESILWCYQRTGDERLLALAENAWPEFLKKAGDPEFGDFSAARIYADTPINSHGVTYSETMKLPAILYLYTGKQKYLKLAQAAERRIFDHHMLIDGIPSTSEYYRTTTSLDLHETCDIADHTWSWGYQLMATGDAVWADRIERACFNAAPGAIKKDWKALQYMSCPNQFLATLNSDHHPQGRGDCKMAYQPNPGKRIACCGGNVHRIFPNYAIRMWMQGTDGGIAAVLYGPSKVSATVGNEHVPVEIEQTTRYPFEEQIHFKIHADRAVSFPLSLRIPAWCDDPQLTLNGKPLAGRRTAKGFLVVRRTFTPGDTLTLTLPMKTVVSRWPQSGVGLEHGPLVYSLPIKAKWDQVVEENYSTAEFPSWEAMPTSDWNYGLALDAAQPTKGVDFTQGPNSANEDLDPWENPPNTLSVAARKIDGWHLQENPENAAQKFTPPLPELSTSKVSQTVERLTLVPYGSTELRVTIFPAVEA
jgi:DUF1680 family protein